MEPRMSSPRFTEEAGRLGLAFGEGRPTRSNPGFTEAEGRVGLRFGEARPTVRKMKS